MRQTLEDLWHSYLMEKNEQSKEEREAISKLVEHEGKLRATLNAEQLEMLETDDFCFSEIAYISERDAFIKGVRFATRYLIEALYGDEA